MATPVDICNLALGLLGDEGTVTALTPPDGSAQAGHCARWYPMALRRCLEDADWHFAMRRAAVTELKNVTPSDYGWTYTFNLPSDCLKVLSVESSDDLGRYARGRRVDFEILTAKGINGRILFTDIESPVLTYTAYLDTATLFPSYFIEPLTILLASYLVGPLKRSDTSSTTAKALIEQYRQSLSLAKTADAAQSQHRREPKYVASALRAREVF